MCAMCGQVFAHGWGLPGSRSLAYRKRGVTMTNKIVTTLGLAIVIAAYGSTASAQDGPPPDPQPGPSANIETVPLTVPLDGSRFRFGIAGSVGGEFVSGYTLFMGGVDVQIGLQINNLIAVYLQPHLSFGGGSINGISGTTGTFAATGLVEFTMADRFFAGVGGGFGVLNNPSGGVLHFHVGFYPLVSVSPTEPRRRGLMIAIDSRTFFTGVGTVEQLMLTVGREVF
jgi:hypothetical protein